MIDSDRHGPNRLTNYIETHTTIMGQLLRGGFALSENLQFTDLGNGFLTLTGVIECAGDIAIDVTKRLAVDGSDSRAMVHTVDYSYNAYLKQCGNIFRYDSPHEDHNNYHHVHRFDPLGGDKEGIVTECSWPHLNEVVQEAAEWFNQNYAALAKPKRD